MTFCWQISIIKHYIFEVQQLSHFITLFFCFYRSWSVRSGWISMDALFHCNVNGVAVIVYCICLGSRLSWTWIQLAPRGTSTHTVTLTHTADRRLFSFLLSLAFHKNTHMLPPIKSNSFTIFKWATLLECKARLLNCNSVI